MSILTWKPMLNTYNNEVMIDPFGNELVIIGKFKDGHEAPYYQVGLDSKLLFLFEDPDRNFKKNEEIKLFVEKTVRQWMKVIV